MDTGLELAQQNSGDMRQEIDSTRSAMADKLEALEDRVMDTVHSAQETVKESIQIAKETVGETVETVKTSVRESVATVKRTFDIKHQVEQHPWVMVGGCFCVGLALGGLFLGARRGSRQLSNRPAGNGTPLAGSPRSEQRGNDSFDNVAPPPQSQSMSANRPGFFDQFHEEIDQVKGIAIGFVMGLTRDSIKDAVPQLASQIDDVMNSITTKLGSKPVQQRS